MVPQGRIRVSQAGGANGQAGTREWFSRRGQPWAIAGARLSLGAVDAGERRDDAAGSAPLRDSQRIEDYRAPTGPWLPRAALVLEQSRRAEGGRTPELRRYRTARKQ